MSTPVLPDWFPRRELSRPTAEQITRAENRKGTLTYAGPNAVIPIVYGEQLVGGPIIAGPAQTGASTIYAVALCWAGDAGLERIEDCRVGESIVNFGAISNPNTGEQVNNSGITIRVFDGRQTQPFSTLVSAIPGFDDDFHGVAYAIISFPTANFTSLPQLTFRIKGRKCPRLQPASWTATPLPFAPNDLRTLTTDGEETGAVVCVGDNGQLASFGTGSSWGDWIVRTSTFGSSAILAIGRGGSNFIVVGEDGKIATGGSGGVSWTARDSGLGSARLNAISMHESPGREVVGGDGGVVARSSDASNPGATWEVENSNFGSSAILAAARFRYGGQDRSCIAGEDGKLALAASGGWGIVDSGFGSSSIRCLITRYGASYSPVNETNWVAALGDDGKVSRYVGAEWVPVDAGFGSANITHAVSLAGIVFALADDGSLRTSTNGWDWKAVEGAPIGAKKLFAARDQLIVVDDSGNGWRVGLKDLGEYLWTENPVLHMLDFVTNDEFGMGVNLIGVEAAANMADSLYSGLPRSRTGLTIQDSMAEEDALALLAMYAEVLWSYDGRDVVIIPDAPVDTVHEIDASAIIGDSLNLTTVGLEQVPTQIRLMFSDREEPTWASRPAVAEMPEHTMHGMPTSPSTVPLPGVFNRLEADRRVWQRLMRLQSPGRLEWQMLAPGMPYQAGDVVRLPDRRGLQSVDVRLTAQPTMIAPLKYQMAGEIYSRSHYPTGSEGVAVPTGAILILRGTGAVPVGWSLMTIPDRLIREGAPGNAGANMTISASYQSNIAGAHSGTRDTATRLLPILFTEGSNLYGPTVYFNLGGYPGPHVSGAHRHSFSISKQADRTVRRRAFRFIKRTGAAGLLPRGVSFLGAENLSNLHTIETPAINGYLAGGSSDAWLPFDNSVSGNTSGGGHMHNGLAGRGLWTSGEPSRTFQVAQESGQHSHSIYAAIGSELRSIALAIFESLGDAALPEGAIVGWDGGAPPAGWALCDGSNGTIDLTERFIYLTASENAGVEHRPESKYTTFGSISGASGAHRHTHTYSFQTQWTHTNAALNPFHDSLEGDHSHYIESGDASGSLDNILRYQLRFIQYIGE